MVEYACPGCGERFRGVTESDCCPSCLEPLMMAQHDRGDVGLLLVTPELSGPDLMIAEMMRTNRGVRAF